MKNTLKKALVIAALGLTLSVPVQAAEHKETGRMQTEKPSLAR